MLNRKIIVACTVVFFVMASGFGLSYYTKDTKQQFSQSKAEESTATKAEQLEVKISEEATEETVEAQKVVEDVTEIEAVAVKDSEEPVQSEKTESIEQKRPSLTTASRSGSLAPKNATEQPKQTAKTPVQPSKPAPPASNTINGWSQEDYYWLAKMIHAESRGEPYEGQVAVGAVILKRVHHPDFPNTVYGVIFDKWDGKYYQFSPVADGSINLEPNETAYKAARAAMNGSDPSGGALYFYNPAKSTSKWILTRPVIKTIGEHTFAL